MEELDIYRKMATTDEAETPQFSLIFAEESVQAQRLTAHKSWLQRIRHERPSTAHPYKVGIYIRYFNQTKHQNYLEYHLKQFHDTIALCPQWQLVDFYIDEGSSPPNMESAPEWCRLLDDCADGKVNLIITQKVSNVSKKSNEMTICARMLASMGVGIYFISEDIFTMASYYREDQRDTFFFPDNDWKILPDDEDPRGMLHD